MASEFYFLFQILHDRLQILLQKHYHLFIFPIHMHFLINLFWVIAIQTEANYAWHLLSLMHIHFQIIFFRNFHYKDLDYYCKSYSQCLERGKSTTLLVLSFGPVEIAGRTAQPTLSSATLRKKHLHCNIILRRREDSKVNWPISARWQVLHVKEASGLIIQQR
jgi:hypothetical protein